MLIPMSEMISDLEAWTVDLPSLGLSEGGDVRWLWLVVEVEVEVEGLLILRWLWMGRNVFGGAAVGLKAGHRS